MSQQKHWFPGQPGHRNIFDFTHSDMEILNMPDAFISEDETFMGNTYESDDGKEQYYIIGRNLVDGLYKEIPGTENLFDATPAEPANCCFTEGIWPDETCSLFIVRENTLLRCGLSQGELIRTEKTDNFLPVTPFSPVISFRVKDTILVGYVFQASTESKNCTLVLLKYQNGTASYHSLLRFTTLGIPTQCYIHVNKNQYAMFFSVMGQSGTVIYTGDINEEGAFSPFTRTLSSTTTFLSATFSRDNSCLFYPDKYNDNNVICTLQLADNSLTRTTVVEDYNMLKLGPNDKIYGLNKFILNDNQERIRLYATIEFLPDSTVDIKEFISTLNGGYFPAEASQLITA